MSDVLIVGGGVIGLSSAWELARQGVKVTVLDQSAVGTEASWAGAGMIPPGDLLNPDTHKLAVLSSKLWPETSSLLREVTGVDNGYRPCGGLLLEEEESERIAAAWQARGITATLLDAAQLHGMVHQLAPHLDSGVHLPTQAQVRNPRHLQALQIVCQKAGVKILAGQQVTGWEQDGTSIQSVITTTGKHTAGEYVVAAGAWSGGLLQQLGIDLPVRPMRGQIVLLKSSEPVFTKTLECGPLYLVPRDDGHILVGATVEDAGFDKSTLPTEIANLKEFASHLVPSLTELPVEKVWAGLRPYSSLHHPTIGRPPGWANLILATGHYRAGLSNSPATSLLIRQLIVGQTPSLDLTPFGMMPSAKT